jgi:hypothetical protein
MNPKVRDYIFVILIYLISRWVMNLSGVTMSLDVLNFFWQLVDADLLKDRPFETLLFMHSQPPGFNAIYACMLRLPPDWQLGAWQSLFYLLGLASCISLFYVLKTWLHSPKIALFGTVLYMLNPGFIAFEHYAFYTFPTLCFISIGYALFLKLHNTKNPVWMFLLAWVLACICLLSSFFHLLWMIIPILWLLISNPKHRFALIACALPGLLTVIFFYGKNMVLFGSFFLSSWFGMNFSRLVEIDAIHTHSGSYNIWAHPNEYNTLISKDNPYPDVPLLNRDSALSGASNKHHFNYIEAGEKFKAEAIQKATSAPAHYLKRIGDACSIYFLPYTYYFSFIAHPHHTALLDALHPYRRMLEFDFLNHKTLIGSLRILDPMWLNILFHLVLLSLSFVYRRQLLSTPFSPLLGWILFHFVYVFLLSNIFECGENMRFRIANLPGMIIILCLLLHCVMPHRKENNHRD